MEIASNYASATLESTIDFGHEVEITMPTKEYPLVIHAVQNVDCLKWGEDYKNQIREMLLEHGAILFRGFKIGDAQKFNQLFTTISGDAMEYKNRTSPRERIHNNVYTSTSHPRDQHIQMHTENSYSTTYNR